MKQFAQRSGVPGVGLKSTSQLPTPGGAAALFVVVCGPLDGSVCLCENSLPPEVSLRECAVG